MSFSRKWQSVALFLMFSFNIDIPTMSSVQMFFNVLFVFMDFIFGTNFGTKPPWLKKI